MRGLVVKRDTTRKLIGKLSVPKYISLNVYSRRNINDIMWVTGLCQWKTFPHQKQLLLLIPLLVSMLQRSKSFDYKDALSKSILYFEAQRSGRLPYNQRVTWRHHSGLKDGLEQGVELVGGYYDAGDNIKFGLPMAFTITMLSWSLIHYRDQIVAAGELQHGLEAIKWGTDYFIKAHTHPHILWAQVGDGESDHMCWQRPEDMTTSRFASKVDEQNPGSDVAGETAAAMAAAAIMFRPTNSHYSHLLLEHAQQLFEFGDKFRERYDKSIEGAKAYYPSVSGYKDELLWAALWLYKATHNSTYLNYAIQNAQSFGGIMWSISEFSWDVKYPGLQIMAAMLPVEGRNKNETLILKQYRSKAEHWVCSCLNKNDIKNVPRTPGGLLFIRQWNNMQYVTTASFLLSVYSDHLHSTKQMVKCPKGSVESQQILQFAKSQVDYILGSNPMGISYFVGYGPAYPKRVHHRGASTMAYKDSKAFIGCTQGYESWYRNEGPNPNVLVGAVVGGPNHEDKFEDKRGNFAQLEACTYNTAPLVGVFAKLISLQEMNSSST